MFEIKVVQHGQESFFVHSNNIRVGGQYKTCLGAVRGGIQMIRALAAADADVSPRLTIETFRKTWVKRIS
jgi:hypothetical protein